MGYRENAIEKLNALRDREDYLILAKFPEIITLELITQLTHKSSSMMMALSIWFLALLEAYISFS